MPPDKFLIKGRNGDTIEETCEGDGPIDACFKAVESINGQDAQLLDYRVQSVSCGQDAKASSMLISLLFARQ